MSIKVCAVYSVCSVCSIVLRYSGCLGSKTHIIPGAELQESYTALAQGDGTDSFREAA